MSFRLSHAQIGGGAGNRCAYSGDIFMKWRINIGRVLFSLFVLFSAGCSEHENGERAVVQQAFSGERFSGESFVDAQGWTWEKSRAVEYLEFNGVPPRPREDGTPERGVLDMSLEELTEIYRPVTEFGGFEYRLSDKDAIALAHEIREFVSQFEGEDLVGGDGGDGYDDVSSVRQSMVIGSDDRVNVNLIAENAPQNRIAGTRFLGPYCTAFKMINQYTAITAAHCVYDRSNKQWYERQDWWFGAGATNNPGGAKRNPLPPGCYQRTVPGGWIDFGGVANDYAIIRFSTAGNDGPWCPLSDYNSGWLGYRSTGGGVEFDVRVQGYPAPPPAQDAPSSSWAYPTLWRHERAGGGWTNSVTYPTRVFYDVDTSGGQSGSPVRDTSLNQIRGIHSGYTWLAPDGFRNEGRRITSDLVLWFQNNAGSD